MYCSGCQQFMPRWQHAPRASRATMEQGRTSALISPSPHGQCASLMLPTRPQMGIRLSSGAPEAAAAAAVLYSNRSAAYCCMSHFVRALEDAQAATALEPG